MGRLDGKVAIVTGAARGQGEAEARLFAAEGATVHLTDVLGEGEAVADDIGATFHRHDVTDEQGWNDLVATIIASDGHVDALVNNAGIYRSAKLVDTEMDEFRQVMDVNAYGVFLGMKAVSGPMLSAESGSIVNISSVAGITASPRAFAYGASKWAVRGMTKTAAVEFARHGVRVNSIHPGIIDTEMIRQVADDDEGRLDRMLRSVPMGRQARADEIANLALFLASDESSYCTGTEFIADGGITAI